ncbi:MAG: hypothetical protein SGI71_01975 [Verrucomicrobiota bacterium]|nr:hypothetical protein [Verrucomicrobiota bacterium]
MKSIRDLFFVLMSLLFWPSAVQAAINPDEFTKSQPEKIVIKVLESKAVDKGAELTTVTLKAKVLEVIQTASGLKPDDVIVVKYVQDHKRVKQEAKELEKKAKTGWVGPQIMTYPEVLKVEEVRLAYLKKITNSDAAKDFKDYAPTSSQYSFKQKE